MSGAERVTCMTYVDNPDDESRDETSFISSDEDSEDDLERVKRHNRAKSSTSAIKEPGSRTQTASVVITRPESATAFIYIHVALFGIVGCVFRIGTDHIFGVAAKTENSNNVINESFVSNLIGCFVMGSLHGSSMGKTRLTSLYTGLTVGFCGSYTDWSKWNLQLSLLLIGETKSASQAQILYFLCLVIGIYAFFGSYQIGLDFGSFVENKMRGRVARKGMMFGDITATIILVTALLCMVVLVLLSISERAESILFALILAPVGACVRNWLIRFKIEKYQFPLGTFICNFTGAVLLSALHILSSRVVHKECNNIAFCWPVIITYAFDTGFCGCFTAISAILAETHSIKRTHKSHAYVYVIITITASQIFTGIINGVNKIAL